MYDDLIGVPFVDGGRDYKTGYDCWGLVLEVFKRYGYNLPDYKIACEDASRINGQVNETRPFWLRVERGEEPPVPALVVIRFNSVFCNHTGIYIGRGRFLHTRQKIGANIDRLDSPAWKKVIEGIYIPNPEALSYE